MIWEEKDEPKYLNYGVRFYQATTLEKSLGIVQQLLLGEKSSVGIQTRGI